MRCSQCHHENASGAKFCNQCGKSLTVPTSTPDSVQSINQETESEGRLYAMLPSVEAALQREGRVTYRKLKYVFGVDDGLLLEIRDELLFKGVAIDVDGRGLACISEALAPTSPTEVMAPSQPASVETSVVPTPAVPTPTPLITPTATEETNESTVVPEISPTDVSPDEPAVVLEPIRRVPKAERRQLTVMFCDLVGSTDLSGQARSGRPARGGARLSGNRVLTSSIAMRATSPSISGDGLLIYFGFPVAHEDDAQRAIYTGLGDSGGDGHAQHAPGEPTTGCSLRCASVFTLARWWSAKSAVAVGTRIWRWAKPPTLPRGSKGLPSPTRR